MLLAGVDDAGRGAVIGPLVIAGILVDETALGELERLGVKDSKLLSRAEREAKASEIEKVALKVVYKVIPPQEIDAHVKASRGEGLNVLEAKKMAEIIGELKPDVAYVDASDVLEERFAKWIRENLPENLNVSIVSKHKADRIFPVVSAAAILAKVKRDSFIDELSKRLGVDLGSGYPHDPKTVRFLRENILSLPDFVRKSWDTVRKLREEALTRKLDSF